jgi:hypothetical protein
VAREVRSTECSDPNLTVAFREAVLAVALAEEVEGLSINPTGFRS